MCSHTSYVELCIQSVCNMYRIHFTDLFGLLLFDAWYLLSKKLTRLTKSDISLKSRYKYIRDAKILSAIFKQDSVASPYMLNMHS